MNTAPDNSPHAVDAPASVPSKCSALCPLCNGIPAHPEIDGSTGCLGCDFTGTHKGYLDTRRMEEEAMVEHDIECGHEQSKLSKLIDERDDAIARANTSERRLRFAEELIRESIRALEVAARGGCTWAHYSLNDARVFLQNSKL